MTFFESSLNHTSVSGLTDTVFLCLGEVECCESIGKLSSLHQNVLFRWERCLLCLQACIIYFSLVSIAFFLTTLKLTGSLTRNLLLRMNKERWQMPSSVLSQKYVIIAMSWLKKVDKWWTAECVLLSYGCTREAAKHERNFETVNCVLYHPHHPLRVVGLRALSKSHNWPLDGSFWKWNKLFKRAFT